MFRAENNDNIFLTIELSDVQDLKVEMKEETVTFSAKSQGKDYALDLKLKKKIQAEVRIETSSTHRRDTIRGPA